MIFYSKSELHILLTSLLVLMIEFEFEVIQRKTVLKNETLNHNVVSVQQFSSSVEQNTKLVHK